MRTAAPASTAAAFVQPKVATARVRACRLHDTRPCFQILKAWAVAACRTVCMGQLWAAMAALVLLPPHPARVQLPTTTALSSRRANSAHCRPGSAASSMAHASCLRWGCQSLQTVHAVPCVLLCITNTTAHLSRPQTSLLLHICHMVRTWQVRTMQEHWDLMRSLLVRDVAYQAPIIAAYDRCALLSTYLCQRAASGSAQ